VSSYGLGAGAEEGGGFLSEEELDFVWADDAYRRFVSKVATQLMLLALMR
jgi:hypothetical protein